MVDVFPRRNLPGSADTWGREVEKRLVTHEGGIAALNQSMQGQNRNTASSLQVLSSQINDLAGRISYYDFNTASQYWSVSLPSYTPVGGTVNFTISESRRVTVSLYLSQHIQAFSDVPASTADVITVTGFLLNGSPVALSSSTFTTIGVSATPTNPRDTLRITTVERAELDLPAGTYAVQGCYVTADITLSDPLNFGSLGYAQATTFVDINQTLVN